MPKATDAVVTMRIEEVLAIRLDGAQFHDIVRYAAEKGWGVESRQLQNYIRRADNLLVERQEKKRRRIIALHLAQRDSLYARAVNAADYRTALSILADKAKLQDLYINERDARELLREMKELTARLTPGTAHADGSQATDPDRKTEGLNLPANGRDGPSNQPA